MKDRERNRPTRISLAACRACGVTAEAVPGGASCPRCEARMVQAVVILPRSGAAIEQASRLLHDTLDRMAAEAPSL